MGKTDSLSRIKTYRYKCISCTCIRPLSPRSMYLSGKYCITNVVQTGNVEIVTSRQKCGMTGYTSDVVLSVYRLQVVVFKRMCDYRIRKEHIQRARRRSDGSHKERKWTGRMPNVLLEEAVDGYQN